jgi:catechol-2,3-dioxygenase
MTIDGFAEVTLQTDDLDVLEAFYRDVVGLEVLAREDDRIWLRAGERARLGLWSPGPKEFGDRGGRHVHFALAVSPGTLAELAARLPGQARRIRGPVEHEGGDRSLYWEDPAGNVVEAWDFFHRGAGIEELAEG